MKFDRKELKKLYVPPKNSHKGQNGKVMVIGGSKLFHSASIWALEIASRFADMVYFSSVDENNELVKGKFQNGIIVPRNKIEEYIQEADAILIGTGLPRKDGEEGGDDDTKKLTERLLRKFLDKKWVIDGGSLQAIEPQVIPRKAIITPHHKEFETLFGIKGSSTTASELARKFGFTILLKGPTDVVSDATRTVEIKGGNAGMTKGGTGDVLAGLVASFYAKNDAFLSASAASYINKKAGESLEKKMGIYFNSSDLTKKIPSVMKNMLT